jgi:lipopolysaccharide/colanic/teichoic acid biosynthesis glycosyltransferase
MTTTAPDTFYARRGKRVLDLVVALGVLTALSPLLLLLVVAIKLDSRGSVFYRQERIGRDGRAFGLWKFRSMVVGAEHRGAGILVERNDARITRVGRWIRKLSLDEIPQLFNVVAGDMSIVGPRPGMRYQAELYDETQRGRLVVRPGVTGWAQVNGRNAIEWPRRIELDLEYIRRMSLGLDLWVMLRTIPSVLAGEGMIAGRDYWKEKAREREAAHRGD